MTKMLQRSIKMELSKALLLIGGIGGLPMMVLANPSVQPSIGAIVQPIPESNLIIRETQRAIIRPEQLQQVEKPTVQVDETRQQGEITISQIKFEHDLQHISDAELQQFIQPYLNKTYRLSEFKTIVSALQQWLMQEHGLIKAQVWLPLQEVEHGQVQLNITQGSLAGYVVSEHVQSEQAERIKQFAEQYLQQGQALTQKNLEHVAYRVMDYTGQFVQIVLIPTANVGQYNVLLDTAEQKAITGNISLDNTGNRYTSRFRDTTSLTVSDLTGRSDQLMFSAQILSQYQRFAYARYELPTVTGLRFGVEGLYSQYKLCCEFKALDAEGDVKQFVADATYTLFRQRDLSVWLGGKLKYWNGSNQQLGTTTSDRELQSAILFGNVAWSNWADHYARVEFTVGNADLDKIAADRIQDQSSAKLAGSYFKFNSHYFLNYPFNSVSSLGLNAQAQLASQNLESSEKISMGGLSAIRAYPYGEAMGDLGAVAQLEYRYQFLPNLQGAAFYDLGYVRRNHEKWVKGTVNQYHLHGLGASVTWQPIQQARLQLITAAKLGDNAGQDSNGHDSDGKDSRVRAWVVGSWSF